MTDLMFLCGTLPAGGKEKPFAAPCRRGGRKNLLRQTCRPGTVGCRFALEPPFPCLVRRSFNEGGTPSFLFQNFLCSLFALELRSKAKSGTSVLKMKKCRRERQDSVCIRGKLSVCTVTLVDFKHIFCKDREGVSPTADCLPAGLPRRSAA